MPDHSGFKYRVADFLTQEHTLPIIGILAGIVFIAYHAYRGHLHGSARKSDNPPTRRNGVISRAIIVIPGAMSAGLIVWLGQFGL